jgi:CPA2 family monovalent cation:H+ antiporter-2
MTDTTPLTALAPTVSLLALGVAAALASRALKLSPVVGYIVLGLILRAMDAERWLGASAISVLAEVGVALLLFDIGLHFTISRLRERASDIFAFGPVQVLASTLLLGAGGVIVGMSVGAALLLGAILALSSTAVVGRLIAERHQQGCPVGLTATSILVFQDVFAILLLVLATAMATGGSLVTASLLAIGKAVLSFAVTYVTSRFVVGRVLGLVARTRNDEIFTAVALLFALAAGWATGAIGLSLTLGAFLGGQALAETPYRAVIAYEIKPFRGLLLGFFFISIGLSLDPPVLLAAWPTILGLTAAVLAIKVSGNVIASLVFRWSIPGSTQLGFLLSQGSEFAFVILALPGVQAIVGRDRAAIVTAVVALTIALTPSVADLGRRLAGHMRRRMTRDAQHELTPSRTAAPVIIVGMGAVGRLVADALISFDIGYDAVERDQARLRAATADGYRVGFGDGADTRLWASVNLAEREISVLTAPVAETIEDARTIMKANYPTLKRFAYAPDEAVARKLRTLGLMAVADTGGFPGLALATAVLRERGVGEDKIERWIRGRLPVRDPVLSEPLLSEPLALGGLG